MSKLVNITSRSPSPGKPPFEDMVWVPGGTFLMGSNDHYPEEAPAHPATVDGFWMERHTVTNEQFARFVEATGHVTLAERAPNPEDFPGAPAENLVPGSTGSPTPRTSPRIRRSDYL